MCWTFLKKLVYNIIYDRKGRPQPPSLIQITTIKDFYSYINAEKRRYERAKHNNQRLNRYRVLFSLKKKPLLFVFR
ncbi:hypothetical protein NPIL_111811 [Nephila pilipes]|uniref:Uncharacterized protein n=1 Tax=Nephila pilipes TaxID=299642 RepID=A0A8X6TMT2_NEPPI|nr:hypothetical protein NPIL_111811 [Nephila pilipes]